MGADGVERHILLRERMEKMLDIGCLMGSRIQPLVKIRWIEKDGHPIMYWPEQLVRLGRQQCARFNLGSV
jgi:hypothetical protein